jgi:hypothetical protein
MDTQTQNNNRDSFMEPIVLVDKQHNQEAHVIVASHYTFDDVLRSARRINVGMFEGNWDLSYIDPSTQKPQAVEAGVMLGEYLNQDINTFYWQYQNSNVPVGWQKIEGALKSIKAEPFSAAKVSQQSFVPQTLEYGSMSKRIVANMIDLVIISIFVGFFNLHFWGTFGKRAMGLKVADENGNPLSFERTTGRFFSKILTVMTFFAGFFIALVTRRKQTLHDLLASSLVLDTEHSRPNTTQKGKTIVVQ